MHEPTPPAGPLGEALRRLAETIEPASPAPAVTTLRAAPANDNQPDFFVPSLCDIALKDGIGLMDIACFRLGSKSMTQRIRHELPGVTVEVLGGRDGLATIHDYDIVLLMISQLTQAMREWRAGRGPRPPMRRRCPQLRTSSPAGAPPASLRVDGATMRKSP